MQGWQGLRRFWFGVIALVIAGVITLQIEGPPPARPIAAAQASLPAHRIDLPAAPSTSQQAVARPAGLDPARPRIAILLSGIGLDNVQSRLALALPGPVSLAITPYAADPASLAAAAQLAGHETLLSLPLEPAGFPLNDAGPHALLTGADSARNDANLAWVLARFSGYVGATGALDGLRGERFAAATPIFAPLLRDLRQRGLFYIDPRAATAALPENARAVDLVIEAATGREAIQAQLAALEERARDRGAAIGLAGPPTPVLLDRLESWAATLAARGVALVPVSALVEPPARRTAGP